MSEPNTAEEQIARCLRMIEKQLAWGDADDWSNYDFSKLSEEVHRRTHVSLSVTTLKRVWGRLKYDSAPALTTLNALAQFAGFKDWRAFCKPDPVDDQRGKLIFPAVTIESRRSPGKWWIMVILIVCMVFIGYFFIASGKHSKIDPDRFSFVANKVKVEGVPNSVIFHYDATAATTDSVFIVQTWDITRKKLVSKDKHEHSAIYYYPGFFKAKLLVDDQVARTHDLWITSGGWLGVAEQEPVPVYFRREECLRGDSIVVDEKLLEKYNLPLRPKAPKIRIFNHQDMGNIMSDNFIFETKIKSPYNDGSGACQGASIIIQCKDDVIILPLVAKACVGNVGLYFCGAQAESGSTDLSAFGCNLNEWTKLRVECIDKQATIFVNGLPAYALAFPNKATGVVGVQYRFDGIGHVKDTRFEYDGHVVKL